MIHRPQYVYPPAPPGYRDEDFNFYFDSFNTPALAQGIPAAATLPNIALHLHRDAPFLWRGVKVFSDASSLGVEFRTPDGELMSDSYQPLFQSFFPSGFLLVGLSPVPLEPGIECPAGSVILLDLANLSAVAAIRDVHTAVVLIGAKRWKVNP